MSGPLAAGAIHGATISYAASLGKATRASVKVRELLRQRLLDPSLLLLNQRPAPLTGIPLGAHRLDHQSEDSVCRVSAMAAVVTNASTGSAREVSISVGSATLRGELIFSRIRRHASLSLRSSRAHQD